ncbi:MAG: sirohydrochlorin cobaltochelatase [Bacillota bacterium]
MTQDKMKKAILVTSFGTSYEQTRKLNIDAVENCIKEHFPGYEIRRAFTSEMVMKVLKKRDGIMVDSPTEALRKLKEEGYTHVVLQPLHIICGYEYHDVLRETAPFQDEFEKLVVGNPLLTTIDDYKSVAEALKNQIYELEDQEAVVFMGHGTDHPINAAYACIQYVFEDLDMKNVFVGTVEGYPEIDSVIKKLQEKNIRKVTLMPLMLVAGDHTVNDMAGDEEDSWKCILQKEGFEVDTYIHGLGENVEIQKIYLEHTKEAVEKL